MKMWVFKIEEQWWNEVSRRSPARQFKEFCRRRRDRTGRRWAGGGDAELPTFFSLFIPLNKIAPTSPDHNSGDLV
jgi:hypothetical protein